MPSYFDRQTIGSSHPSRRRGPSGHHNIGVPTPFTPVDASQHRGRAQQDQHQSCQPSVTPQGLMGYGHDAIFGTIPPPFTHTYDNSRCPRCRHRFTSQAELDHHTLVCGAAALLTEMFTPYSVQQSNQCQRPQPHFPPPHGVGGRHQTQYQNQNQYRRA